MRYVKLVARWCLTLPVAATALGLMLVATTLIHWTDE